jgi:hypothetical protein
MQAGGGLEPLPGAQKSTTLRTKRPRCALSCLPRQKSSNFRDFCIAPPGSHPLQSKRQDVSRRPLGSLGLTTKEETRVALTCPSCGNDQNFLVKTLQMHVVHVDDSRVEVSEEGRPAVLEVLCDECENALRLEDMDDGIRKELLLTLGAR